MPRQPRAAVPYDEPPMQTSASTPTNRAVPGDGYGFAQVGRGRMAPPRFALPLADRLARARFRVDNHMQAVEALARFTGEAAGRG